MRRLMLPFLILILFPLVSCDEIPQEPSEDAPGSVFRTWRIEGLANDAEHNRLLDADSRGDGEIHLIEDLGPMSLNPQGSFPNALAQILSNRDGSTYWASVEAPTSTTGLTAPDSLIGGEAELRQVWRYRKTGPGSSLRMLITRTHIEGWDGNGQGVDFDDCPWWVGGPVAQFPVECASLIKGEVEASFYAYADPVSRSDTVDVFYYASGSTLLFGFADRWSVDAYPAGGSMSPMFSDATFDTNLNLDGFGRHVRTRLTAPIAIEIPLDSIEPGVEFEVVAFVRVRAYSRRQGESYISAFFRDPIGGDGLGADPDGLVLLEAPDEIPPLRWTAPSVECTGGGGTIGFDTPAYLHPEWPGDRAHITVTRSGGSGPASAVFATVGGTASPGVDYTDVTTVVRFADGETGRRVVSVPIHPDTVLENNETVTLALSTPSCASIDRASAELTIYDDDGDNEPALFALGGTVTGLEGTGLRLRNRGQLVNITADGPFVFPGEYPTGDLYDVTVEQQPSDPLQACSVANGAGTFGSEDVDDVLVTCATPAVSGLDPTFGTNGLVNVDIVPNSDVRFAATVALQTDGRILVAGGGDVARYNPDGTLDASFGSGGIVPIQFRTSSDPVLDVAVQPDGRILVAGSARDLVNLPANDDFAIARLEANGTLDTSFGAGGVTVVDFAERPDAADDILLQPDGSIVLVGAANSVDQFGSSDADFGIVRLNSAGQLDATFGSNGRLTFNIAGRSDGAHAAALMSDGSIVVTGRAAESGGDDPEIAVVRIDAAGVPDSTFGDAGIVWSENGPAGWSIDIAVDASDRILVSGHSGLGAFVARYLSNGDPDTGFGNAGILSEPTLSNGNGIAIDDDGRIIVVGAAGPDFGVLRLTGNGAVDTSFADDGLLTVDFFADFDNASDVVIQPDGRIVVVGKTENGVVRRVGIIRVVP